MKCRRLHRDEQRNATVVWFGSYGKNPDGTAKFYNSADKHDNYGTDFDYEADSLQQKLSVIRGELAYDISHGLPLMEGLKDKVLIDMAVSEIITENPGVIAIQKLESTKSGNNYSANIIVETEFGQVEISV